MRISALFLCAFGLAMAGCDDGSMAPVCKVGTLNLHVALRYAVLADTIEVKATAPPLDEKFAHTPDTLGYAGNTDVEVTFPDHYPGDKLVNFYVTALAKGQPLAQAIAQIHLTPGCSEGAVTLLNLPPATDGGAHD